MKHKLTRLFLATFVCVFSAAVFADEQPGAIGRGSSKVDYYKIECFDDGNGATELLHLAIRDRNGINANSVFSAMVLKGTLALSTTDNGPDGDARISPVIRTRGGDGLYDVLVSKSRAAADDYELEFHCLASNNRHTGTSMLPLIQNQ